MSRDHPLTGTTGRVCVCKTVRLHLAVSFIIFYNMFVQLAFLLCIVSVSFATDSRLESLENEVMKMKKQQAHEIQALKTELESSKNYILQLQSEVKKIKEKPEQRRVGEAGFTAYYFGQHTTDINQAIPFTTVVDLIPNTLYDVATSKLTCNPGGYYWASATVYMISTTKTLTIQLVVDFVEQVSSYAYELSTETGLSITISGLVFCAAGSELWVRAGQNGAVISTPLNRSTSFSAIFLA